MREPVPRRLDLLVPALIAVVGAVETIAAGYEPLWIALGAILLAAGVLSFARLLPLVVPLLVTTVYAVAPLAGFDVSQQASWIPLLAFAYFCTGLHAPRNRWFVGLAAVIAALAIAMAGLTMLTDFEPNLLFGLIMSLGPWAFGLALRKAIEENRRIGAQAERERLDAALAVQRATYAERERIAVELPDVLAHSLGAMVLQASAAGDLVRREPGSAARGLQSVAQAGREALVETGRLLRLLRDENNELGLRHEPVAPGAYAPAQISPARRIRCRDLLLPAVFGTVATIEILSSDYRALWTSLGAYWVAVGLLFARRALPLAMPVGVMGVAVGARLLGAEVQDPASWILVCGLACFSAGRHVPRSRAALGLAGVVAAIALLALDSAARGELSADLVLVAPFAIAPWAVGVGLREALDRTRVLAAGAELARLERELEAERAAAAERRRIARDLHDVLANSLNVMVVQASLAADLIFSDPERAIRAVTEVVRSGRSALDETGPLLRLIHNRTEDLGTRPQPGVTDIPSLAAKYTDAGLGITLEMDCAERLPAGVDLSVYHVVREALTNALKHAPGSPVRVRLTSTRCEVAVDVANGPAPTQRVPAVPSGHGLVGLRERVTVFGGSLDAGPTVDGGFLLTARMPVVEAE